MRVLDLLERLDLFLEILLYGMLDVCTELTWSVLRVLNDLL